MPPSGIARRAKYMFSKGLPLNILPTEARQSFTHHVDHRLGGPAVTTIVKEGEGEDLTIDGSVEGSIDLGNHTLTIGDGAAVKADLTARTISVSGSVTGNLTASERVVLQPTASVEGDIITPRLMMAEGALVKGKVDSRGGK